MVAMQWKELVVSLDYLISAKYVQEDRKLSPTLFPKHEMSWLYFDDDIHGLFTEW